MKYSKTEVGQQAFKARSALFSARQRSAYILFDGVKSNDQVLAATVGLGITRDDIDYLVQQGFLVPPVGALVAPVPAPVVSAEATKLKEMVGPEAVSSRSQPESYSAGLYIWGAGAPAKPRTPQERYSAAMPIATKLTASLGLRGFMLNLAVEGASGFNELLALLPKIQDAVGAKPCRDLEQALKG